MADYRVRDMLERLLWTFVQSFIAALALETLVWDTAISSGTAALYAALFATLTTVVGWLSLIARHRLAVLPDPGDMFDPAADQRNRSRSRHPSNPNRD